MITTLLILILIAFSFLYKSKNDVSGNFFLSKDFTTTVKGICALVVVFVHFPGDFGNALQDAIGSFAYVAVTLFFLFSAYGMFYSYERGGYLRSFWRNRLVSLLTPQLCVNIAFWVLLLVHGLSPVAKDLWQVNNYIIILLEYCVAFYAVVLIKDRFFKTKGIGWAIAVLNCLVFASSIIIYVSRSRAEGNVELDWCYERWGLIWGSLLYYYRKSMLSFVKKGGKPWRLAALIGASAVLGVMYITNKEVWLYGEYLLKILLGAVIILTLFVGMYGRVYFNAILKFLGNASFEIYLCHVAVMDIVYELCGGVSSNLFVGLTFGVTILLASLIRAVDSKAVKLLRR